VTFDRTKLREILFRTVSFPCGLMLDGATFGLKSST
jgi:hypothetical protein